jgi:cation:H+ antiporter
MHTIFILTISFIALLWSANHLVTGASALAHRFQIPPLIMGLTLIAFGTSLPELFFAITDSLKNEDTLTISNTIGSNIANIGLVLGITILLKPNALNYHNLKKTYPIVLIAMLFVYTLILDGYLSRIDGCLFLLACIIILSIFVYLAYHSAYKDPFFNPFKNAMSASHSIKTNSTRIFLGLLILPISAKYIVMNATEMGSWFHLDKLTIGLTIQAIGTTLPELATAVVAAFKNEEDLAVGTILGSNIYNLLLVLAFPALISPTKISTLILWRDMPVMIILTLFLVFLNYNYKKELSPWHGGILLLVYCCYIVSLIIKAHA